MKAAQQPAENIVPQKALSDASGGQWLKMSAAEKEELINKVIKVWERSGKGITKDTAWFIKAIDEYYSKGDKNLNAAKVFSQIAVYGGVFKDSAALDTSKAAEAWKSYLASPDSNPNIPNNSFAGYKYGEVPIPDVPVAVNAADVGAIGDGKTDSTDAINNALKMASDKGGGAVLLPAGTYVVSNIIYMKYNNVVLKGEGPDKTAIKFMKPLNQAYGNIKRKSNDDQSVWMDRGGLVWFTPINDDPVYSNWAKTSNLARIVSDGKRGDYTIKVDKTIGLAAGQKVLILYKQAPDFSLAKIRVGSIPGAENFDWANKLGSQFKQIEWPVEIQSASGDIVTLKQPLRLDMKASWSCEIVKMPPVIENSGVENLAIDIEMPGSYKWQHEKDFGYNGVFFQCSWNCWARNIVVKDSENAFLAVASKCITMENTSVEGICWHYGYCMYGDDCLVTKFTINPQARIMHGLNTNGEGNVYSQGEVRHGTFDYHRMMPYDYILTDITINNDGQHGMKNGTVPLYGARVAHWNIKITNSRPYMIYAPNLMPYGAVVGVEGCNAISDEEKSDFEGKLFCLEESSGKSGKRVEPGNLYQAQLKLRLQAEEAEKLLRK